MLDRYGRKQVKALGKAITEGKPEVAQAIADSIADDDDFDKATAKANLRANLGRVAFEQVTHIRAEPNYLKQMRRILTDERRP